MVASHLLDQGGEKPCTGLCVALGRLAFLSRACWTEGFWGLEKVALIWASGADAGE